MDSPTKEQIRRMSKGMLTYALRNVEKGWTQGTMFRDHGGLPCCSDDAWQSCCLVGALHHAKAQVPNDPEWWPEGEWSDRLAVIGLVPADIALADAIAEACGEDGRSYIAWNDERGRTADQVKGVLKAAIASL